MRVVLSGSARRELTRTYALLDLNFGQATADRFLDSVGDAVERIRAFPEIGALRPALRHGVPNVRMLPVPGFRNCIYYRVLDNRIRIERVLRAGVDLTTLKTPTSD